MKSARIQLHKLDIPPLDFLAREIVEGALTGLHRSPFHGFSSEFREHKMYTPGEPVKFIDWKVYGKTDKLYIKKFDEETNMRVRLVIDASSSMYFPPKEKFDLKDLNKIGFAVVASAVLNEIFRRQRDAVGLSVFHEDISVDLPSKTNTLHRKIVLGELEKLLTRPSVSRKTYPARNLHTIADRLKRRSLTVLFSDLWPGEESPQALIEALRHLRYKSSELIVFHVFNKSSEADFSYPERPFRFKDVETGETLNIYPGEIRKNYREAFQQHLKTFREAFYRYGIDYWQVHTETPYREVISAYLQKRLRMK